MLRRNTRLQLLGYYNSEGNPTISYKETLYKVFSKRRNQRCVTLDTYSKADAIPYTETDLKMDTDTIPYIETDLKMDTDTIPYIEMDLKMDTDTIPYTDLYTDTIPYADSYMNTKTDTEMTAEEEFHFENRRTTRSRQYRKNLCKNNFGWFYVTCLLFFVLAIPIYAPNFNISSSKPAESPASSFAVDLAFNRYCEEKKLYPAELMEALIGSITTVNDSLPGKVCVGITWQDITLKRLKRNLQPCEAGGQQ
ncbi:uncharacterized protein LOC124875971 isoform X1 [Girardinichthys multiradiatus]|uniref:uncharacterized protein LOC124875971 isoform X1 n=1 Tax=Girardinichthys multiradiatus TaxID=208333 RepID=UPI001FABD540|nr:uncharacterized protein LOC124875971 isoform X1 [Girardinichthys multiradiatus]XP_047234377.1 uncharacterized protein LOC124875971 isoform X2 [Girardinichthys multiradiatus]XP_047234378.1 uncharacterized protein LOC124875971 isoform X1 [Girardinichthys multiradiatus]